MAFLSGWRGFVPATGVLVAVGLALVDPLFLTHAQESVADLVSGFLRRAAQGSPTYWVLSKDPVVVYIKDFITSEEAAHLVAVAY